MMPRPYPEDHRLPETPQRRERRRGGEALDELRKKLAKDEGLLAPDHESGRLSTDDRFRHRKLHWDGVPDRDAALHERWYAGISARADSDRVRTCEDANDASDRKSREIGVLTDIKTSGRNVRVGHHPKADDYRS